MKSRIIAKINTLNLSNAEVWITEAKFGFRHVKEKIKELPNSSSILEVGCGSGILLSMLTEEFPQNIYEGIEPLNDDFSLFKELNSLVKGSGIKIENCGYEDYDSHQTYDLIYCVNVFEHVKDWKHFLHWVSKRLNDDGLFFVLCPNYSFPYESHFFIPVLFNKRTTYRFFKNYIDAFGMDNDDSVSHAGLWDSLNFVKKRNVIKFIRNNKRMLRLDFNDEVDIVDDLVSRVVDDAEFRKRQVLIGNIALFMKKIGAFNFVKLFPNFLPYMKLSFRKHR